MKRKIQNYLPNFIINFIKNKIYKIGRRSYSQEGEDLILARYFEGRERGFYIDIGAHHPFRFSNTCFFFKRGWSGINIDAMPDSMTLFKKHRPNDINIEIGIGEYPTKSNFFIFNEPALNTFDKSIAEQRNNLPNKIIEIKEIEIQPLSAVLEKNLPKNQKIDFLSIDVEGRDLSVLKSNAWEEYRPELIVIETMSKNIEDLLTSECAIFLKNIGYTALSKAIHSSIFIDSKLIKNIQIPQKNHYLK